MRSPCPSPVSLDNGYGHVSTHQTKTPEVVITSSPQALGDYKRSSESVFNFRYSSDSEEDSVASEWDRTGTASASPPPFPSPLSLSPVATELSDVISECPGADRVTEKQDDGAAESEDNALTVMHGADSTKHTANNYSSSMATSILPGSGLAKEANSGLANTAESHSSESGIQEAIKKTMCKAHPGASHFDTLGRNSRQCGDCGQGASIRIDSSETFKRKGRKNQKYDNVTGLVNLGNTCFMNVTLQTLSHTPPLRKYLDPSDIAASMDELATHSSSSLWAETRRLLSQMWRGAQTEITPIAYLQKVRQLLPQFQFSGQHDAHEFLRPLMDNIQTHFSKTTSFDNVFRGLLCDKTRYNPCGHQFANTEPFMDLSLEIPEYFVTGRSKIEEQWLPCTLDDCLRAFTEVEELSAVCKDCGAPQRCSKRYVMEQLPEILCLHLKRFRCRVRGTRSYGEKVTTYVQFPILNLDMGPYTAERVVGKHVYCLYSVVVHHGNFGSGHYVAYTWSQENNSWFHLNDSSAVPVSVEALIELPVYQLFYVKTGPVKEGRPWPPPAKAEDVIYVSGKRAGSRRGRRKDADLTGVTVAKEGVAGLGKARLLIEPKEEVGDALAGGDDEEVKKRGKGSSKGQIGKRKPEAGSAERAEIDYVPVKKLRTTEGTRGEVLQRPRREKGAAQIDAGKSGQNRESTMTGRNDTAETDEQGQKLKLSIRIDLRAKRIITTSTNLSPAPRKMSSFDPSLLAASRGESNTVSRTDGQVASQHWQTLQSSALTRGGAESDGEDERPLAEHPILRRRLKRKR